MKKIEDVTSNAELEDLVDEVDGTHMNVRETNDLLDELEENLVHLDAALDINALKASRIKKKMRKVMNRL